MQILRSVTFIILIIVLMVSRETPAILPPDCGDSFHSLAFSPDGRTLACVGSRGVIQLWSLKPVRLEREMMSHRNGVNSVAFAPDGKTLATGSAWMGGGTAELWDAQAGRRRLRLPGISGYYHALAFSPDGRTLAAVCKDDALRLWDVRTGRLLRVLKAPYWSPFHTAFSPDGQSLAASGSSKDAGPAGYGEMHIWDAYTGKSVKLINGITSPVQSFAFSPDGLALACATFEGRVGLFDTRTWKLGKVWRAAQGPIMALAYSPDGQTLATGADANWNTDARTWELRMWNPATGRLRRILTCQNGSVSSLSFSPDNQYIAACAGHYGSLAEIRNARTGRLLVSLAFQRAYAPWKNPSSWLAFTPKGYYSGSGEMLSRLQVQIGRKAVPLGKYGRRLYRPDIVDQVF